MNLKSVFNNTWFRIVFGLIIGPPLAVCVAKVILLQEDYVGNYLFIPVLIFILIVLIKAAVIRAITGARTLRAYAGSLLMSILVIVCLAFVFLWEFSYSFQTVFSIPILIIVLGVGYRIKNGPSPLGELFIIPAVLIAFFIEGDLFANYDLLPRYQLFARIENPVYWLPLFLIIPLIEVWPASILFPKGKVEIAIIVSNLAVIFFFANAFIFTYLAVSWLTS